MAALVGRGRNADGTPMAGKPAGESGPVSHLRGVALGDGLRDAAGLAFVPGRGVALEIGRMPAISGVSITPTVFLSTRPLRNTVGVIETPAMARVPPSVGLRALPVSRNRAHGTDGRHAREDG